VLPGPSDLPSEFGRYVLASVLGEGGMARVYRAVKSGPGGFETEVALKIVKRKAGKRSEFVQLLTREAVIGGFLRHPNIVATLDFDAVGAHYYIAMEFVEGTTLEALISSSKEKKRAFPPTLALDIVQQLCRGLGYAHSLADRNGKPLNIIHRDIKPGNIMVSNHGVAKITDFGIAKASVETGVVTATNVVRGTPLYMSPEQATGRDLDYRSDLFSVGLILFELLTGKRLFEMKDIVSTMESIARAEIGTAPAEVDAIIPGVGDVLRTLLQLHPRARYDSADEVEQELATLVAASLGPDETGENSLREQLKVLTTSVGELEAAGKTRTPTLPDTRSRIPLDLASIDSIDIEEARKLRDSAAEAERAAAAAAAENPSAPEDINATLPWLDPVIKRTAIMMKVVKPDDEALPDS